MDHINKYTREIAKLNKAKSEAWRIAVTEHRSMLKALVDKRLNRCFVLKDGSGVMAYRIQKYKDPNRPISSWGTLMGGGKLDYTKFRDNIRAEVVIEVAKLTASTGRLYNNHAVQNYTRTENIPFDSDYITKGEEITEVTFNYLKQDVRRIKKEIKAIIDNLS